MATIIFKPTEACNAGCAYCDVISKDSRITKVMSHELLELMFVRVNEFLLERPEEQMEIIWHGGEPLLLGERYFVKALEFQQKHCASTSSRIRHAIQSNLTLFSDEFTEVFRKLGIRCIGTSYDPTDGVRTLMKQQDSQAYNARFMEGLRLLEKEGFDWGPIYVVTKLSLAKPLDIFYFLTNLSPSGKIMFNPVLIYGNNQEHLRISPEEFANFLGVIFPVWWRHRERYLNIEPFSSMVHNLIDSNGMSLSCNDSGDCFKSHINVAPDGRYSQCGRSSDWGLLDYGSISERSIADVFRDPQRDMLTRRDKVLETGECSGCRFWQICHGGCPLDAWSGTGSLMRKSEWCDVKRVFIEKYFEPITGIRYDGTVKKGC